MIMEDQIEQGELDGLGEPLVLQADGWAPAYEKEEFFARKDENLVGQKMTPSCFTYRPVWSFKRERECLSDVYDLRLLYGVLWSFSNLDFIAWPSIDEVVERSGMTVSFVLHGFNQLMMHGLISIHEGVLVDSRACIDFADRDPEDMRLLLLDVPKRMRPNLTRASRT